MARIQLVHLAHARSGDKGDTANVGVIALRPEYYPILVEQLTTARVKQHFQGLGIHAVPSVIINNRHLIQGGQPPEYFEQALRQVAAEG